MARAAKQPDTHDTHENAQMLTTPPLSPTPHPHRTRTQVLMVATSHNKLGETGQATGLW